ncbi:hypothetical protein [Actinomycetospora termitidis]|uniref:Uncharacterized protein n=1 Tax=Actinomycetospora termitidis TaxID=3053470 RepID=A0ABT7M9R6_9PSEU|nr:hypothetical protein [Actinomycetospora sp. Odt1-22]MDL5157418.1 hypothetical protein [Actinomycetospora sp. Odt1-22]
MSAEYEGEATAVADTGEGPVGGGRQAIEFDARSGFPTIRIGRRTASDEVVEALDED